MAASSEGWVSLPASTRFAGASEQPRAPRPTVAAWPPPPARGSAPPPPPSGVRIAPTVEERIKRLGEDVGDLEIFGNAWQAAAFSAAALLKALDARAVIVHAVDEATSELRIVGVKGANTNDLLGETAPLDDDFVASTAASNGRPLAMAFDGDLPRVMPSRFTTVRAKTSLVAVPLIASGRCVGLIEVIDASSAKIATDAGTLVAARLLSSLR